MKLPALPRHIANFALANSEMNRAKLDPVFALPRAVHRVLKETSTPFQSPLQAKLLLLARLKELMPLMHQLEADGVIGIIDACVQAWFAGTSPLCRLTFSGNCSIKTDCTAVWLPDIKSLAFKDPGFVRSTRDQLRARYVDRFDLIASDDGYVVQVPFVTAGRADRSHPISAKVPRCADGTPARFGTGMNGVALTRLLTARRAELDRIAAAFVTPDFDELAGRPVQGGLPSLGTRR
ncbi:hypothetical protein [Piscinibacterium candidicorallinum]|uniref:Uncharacterized protein n=1 Tax=Piscinibacterium candidicorallinum TaxID=1793872 RepID=A0ABV7H1J5_9BURK